MALGLLVSCNTAIEDDMVADEERSTAEEDAQDPVLQMRGVGKKIWSPEGGDAFIACERCEFDSDR